MTFEHVRDDHHAGHPQSVSARGTARTARPSQLTGTRAGGGLTPSGLWPVCQRWPNIPERLWTTGVPSRRDVQALKLSNQYDPSQWKSSQ